MTLSTSPEEICNYVLRHYGERLTARQVRSPWTYLSTAAGNVSGVVIPADGEATGLRVLVDLGAAVIKERIR